MVRNNVDNAFKLKMKNDQNMLKDRKSQELSLFDVTNLVIVPEISYP